MRRICVTDPPTKVRNPAQHIRKLRRWAEGFAGSFPALSEDHRHEYWKIPVIETLVCPPMTTPEIQRQCAQALIDGAAHLARAKQAKAAGSRVAVMLVLPDTFLSAIEVYIDEDEFRSYVTRDVWYQRWTRLPKARGIAREMKLVLPPGFRELGFRSLDRSPFGPKNAKFVESEVWFIGEVALSKKMQASPSRIPSWQRWWPKTASNEAKGG